MTTVIRLALGSILVGLLVLGLKLIAWQITGSVALLSDALESIVNVTAAFAALIAIRVAALPPDDNHPYGHHKAEFFSAILEGAMIIVAALVIIHEAWVVLFEPRVLDIPMIGLAINILASVINGGWCWVLIRQGRKHRSPALVADGRHLLSDVVSSVGVTFGVLVAVMTGWAILDPLMALIVAVNILWSGWKVMRESMSGLMDEAVSEQRLSDIRDIIAAEAIGAVEAHDLRTRHAGSATFIDFHLVVPGDLTVAKSHAMCDRVEAAMRKKIPGCRINIHVEPEHKAKHEGVVEI